MNLKDFAEWLHEMQEMYARHLIEVVIFPWFGISLILAAIGLFCCTVGISIPEKAHRVMAGVAIAPILLFIVIAAVALLMRAAP